MKNITFEELLIKVKKSLKTTGRDGKTIGDCLRNIFIRLNK